MFFWPRVTILCLFKKRVVFVLCAYEPLSGNNLRSHCIRYTKSMEDAYGDCCLFFSHSRHTKAFISTVQ